MPDPSRAGHGLVTLAVDDLDEAITAIEARGLSASGLEAVTGAGRKACFTDPSGNTVVLVELGGTAS
ncbi:MAG: VOC family protein [Acidimicrobiales bacterium]